MTLAAQTTIGFGDYGSVQTMSKMRSFVTEAIKQPIVVETAHEVVRFVAPRDYLRMAVEIRNWLARNFKFIPDPVGVELVRTPEYMLNQFNSQSRITGDCDDAAVLGCALGMAVGLRCKFVAVGFRNFGPLEHVYGVLFVRGVGIKRCVSLDVTKPRGATAQVRRRVELVV